jgi:hypothetical protein
MMSEGAGPFSMLSVSALENHIKSVTFAGKTYAAIQWGVPGGPNVTESFIFGRGILGYNDQQELILRDFKGGGQKVEPGDWIVMLSRTAYAVMSLSSAESLFSLMPDVALSTPEARLSRIAEAHKKDVDEHGGTHGVCVECYQVYPCPAVVWATKDRDPLATWDPIDDEPEEGVEDGA